MLQNDLYKIRQILVNESYPDYSEFDIIQGAPLKFTKCLKIIILSCINSKNMCDTPMNGEFCRLSESVRVLMLKQPQKSTKLLFRDVTDFVHAHLKSNFIF